MALAIVGTFGNHNIANIKLIFKASYDKANRSSIDSFRGPGLKKGLKILHDIKKELSLNIITDVHNENEVEEAGNEKAEDQVQNQHQQAQPDNENIAQNPNHKNTTLEDQGNQQGSDPGNKVEEIGNDQQNMEQNGDGENN